MSEREVLARFLIRGREVGLYRTQAGVEVEGEAAGIEVRRGTAAQAIGLYTLLRSVADEELPVEEDEDG